MCGLGKEMRCIFHQSECSLFCILKSQEPCLREKACFFTPVLHSGRGSHSTVSHGTAGGDGALEESMSGSAALRPFFLLAHSSLQTERPSTILHTSEQPLLVAGDGRGSREAREIKFITATITTEEAVGPQSVVELAPTLVRGREKRAPYTVEVTEVGIVSPVGSLICFSR